MAFIQMMNINFNSYIHASNDVKELYILFLFNWLHLSKHGLYTMIILSYPRLEKLKLKFSQHIYTYIHTYIYADALEYEVHLRLFTSIHIRIYERFSEHKRRKRISPLYLDVVLINYCEW